MVAETLSQLALTLKFPSPLDMRMAKVKSLTAESVPGTRKSKGRSRYGSEEDWWIGQAEVRGHFYIHLFPLAEGIVMTLIMLGSQVGMVMRPR